ncbi:MAG: thiamine diphosphokinase [Clostridia bacterium]|nr:thiamine diphosphokinase [Clostridia bacterium]
MGRCVIIGAGGINDYETIKNMIRPDDTIVCADGGYVHAKMMKLSVDCVIGDFDSSAAPEHDSVITLPVEKDVTDTQFCAREFVGRGYRDFLLLGMTGGRFDHTYSNLQTLYYLKKNNCNAVIADEFNKIYLISENEATVKFSGYSNISFFALFESVKAIEIRGAKYELSSYDLKVDDPLCVSNSFVGSHDIFVGKSSGTLLVIESN